MDIFFLLFAGKHRFSVLKGGDAINQLKRINELSVFDCCHLVGRLFLWTNQIQEPFAETTRFVTKNGMNVLGDEVNLYRAGADEYVNK